MHIEAYSTDRLTPSQSVRCWQAAAHRINARDFIIKPLATEAFHGSVRTYFTQRHRFCAVNASSHVCTWRPAAAKPYVLALLTSGSVRVLQDGRETVLGSGDAVLVDTSRPLHIETNPLQAAMIDICPNRLREILPQVEGLTAIPISGQAPAGRILAKTIHQLFDLPPETDDQVIDLIADAIPHLAAAALAELPAARHAVPRRSEAYHRHRVLDLVRSRLRDNELGPQTIAQALGLSPRYIHKLFAGEPHTLMQYIRNERLERCRNELGSPSLTHRSISEIAYGWGFNQPAHFSRTFTARFGESPSLFRRKALCTLRQLGVEPQPSRRRRALR